MLILLQNKTDVIDGFLTTVQQINFKENNESDLKILKHLHLLKK